jgi:hypothetical protein
MTGSSLTTIRHGAHYLRLFCPYGGADTFETVVQNT